jgi:hypothetical protein
VRAVITEHAAARQILDSLAKHARAPPQHHDKELKDAVLDLDSDYA